MQIPLWASESPCLVLIAFWQYSFQILNGPHFNHFGSKTIIPNSQNWSPGAGNTSLMPSHTPLLSFTTTCITQQGVPVKLPQAMPMTGSARSCRAMTDQHNQMRSQGHLRTRWRVSHFYVFIAFPGHEVVSGDSDCIMTCSSGFTLLHCLCPSIF